MHPWQLDHQVLQAEDCGKSVFVTVVVVVFPAALGFPYLLVKPNSVGSHSHGGDVMVYAFDIN